MTKLTITWQTMHDDKVCPICKDLESYVWVFETGKDIMTGSLSHPTLGIVWDTQVGSLVHGHRGNCRCRLIPNFDLSDLIVKLKQLYTELEQEVRPFLEDKMMEDAKR